MAKKASANARAKATRKKTGVKKAAPKRGPRTPRNQHNSASPGVTIRMYCQGLGDCFLLTFRENAKAKPVRVLIDCGVFLNTPGEPARMRDVAMNIRDETKGEIDLLIVTHEHWDHIAGFSHANDIFSAKGFKFGQVWLSWAENPDDTDARAVKTELGKKKAKLKAALQMASAQIGPAGAAGTTPLHDDLSSCASILGFLGPEIGRATGMGMAAAKTGSNAPRMDLGTTMDWLRAKTRAQDFCTPGQRRAVPGVSGVSAYVVGPPRGVSQLRKMDPTGDQGYKLQADRVSLFGAIEPLLDGDDSAAPPPGPFEQHYAITPEEAALDEFFRRRYGFPDDPLSDPVDEWRRIDHDWLVGGLSRLALQLDVGVNNTSLALVFELPDGRTLIFPGDAQIGNWLSWAEHKFKTRDAQGHDADVTIKELLNRAIFYKVGHHGSHNATLRAGGLEEMTSGDLVAMIPTDSDFAKTKRPPKTGWEMPAHGVNEALHTFTNGRIIRADHESLEHMDEEVDEETRNSRSWQDFRKRVKFGGKFSAQARKKAGMPLYVEYWIPS